MYSYADRLRAVELYVRLGKRLNATIRKLGYSTKNALILPWSNGQIEVGVQQWNAVFTCR